MTIFGKCRDECNHFDVTMSKNKKEPQSDSHLSLKRILGKIFDISFFGVYLGYCLKWG